MTKLPSIHSEACLGYCSVWSFKFKMFCVWVCKCIDTELFVMVLSKAGSVHALVAFYTLIVYISVLFEFLQWTLLRLWSEKRKPRDKIKTSVGQPEKFRWLVAVKLIWLVWHFWALKPSLLIGSLGLWAIRVWIPVGGKPTNIRLLFHGNIHFWAGVSEGM